METGLYEIHQCPICRSVSVIWEKVMKYYWCMACQRIVLPLV